MMESLKDIVKYCRKFLQFRSAYPHAPIEADG